MSLYRLTSVLSSVPNTNATTFWFLMTEHLAVHMAAVCTK